MKLFPKVIIVLLFIIGLFLSLYLFKVEVNKSIFDKTKLVENSLELKYSGKIEELNKELLNLKLLVKKNTDILSSINNISIGVINSIKENISIEEQKSKILNDNKKLGEAIKIGDKNICNNILDKNKQLLCKNNIYYLEAQDKLDSSFCSKIKNNNRKLEICNKKVQMLQTRDNIN